MPASAGRTTMCPTELGYDADVPPCLRLLPIETRLQPQALMEWRMAPEKWTRVDLDVNDPQQLARRWRKWPRCARSPRTRPARWASGTTSARRQPHARCHGMVEVPVAPRADQHCRTRCSSRAW
jgi:hypothetical protein